MDINAWSEFHKTPSFINLGFFIIISENRTAVNAGRIVRVVRFIGLVGNDIFIGVYYDIQMCIRDRPLVLMLTEAKCSFSSNVAAPTWCSTVNRRSMV